MLDLGCQTYPRVCIAAGVCLYNKTLAEIVEELGSEKILQAILEDWIARGLVRQRRKRKIEYDWEKLCKAYEKYVDCVRGCLASLEPGANPYACMVACEEESGLA